MPVRKSDLRRLSVVSPGFVSNGHWIMRRSMLPADLAALTVTAELAKASGLMDPSSRFGETQKDEFFTQRTMPEKVHGAVTWTVSGLLVDAGKGGPICRVLISETGKATAVNADYCRMLGLDLGATAAGQDSPQSCLFSAAESPDWAVMPMRLSLIFGQESLAATVAALNALTGAAS